jgi:uncharacterized membrane protein YfcA
MTGCGFSFVLYDVIWAANKMGSILMPLFTISSSFRAASDTSCNFCPKISSRVSFLVFAVSFLAAGVGFFLGPILGTVLVKVFYLFILVVLIYFIVYTRINEPPTQPYHKYTACTCA